MLCPTWIRSRKCDSLAVTHRFCRRNHPRPFSFWLISPENYRIVPKTLMNGTLPSRISSGFSCAGGLKLNKIVIQRTTYHGVNCLFRRMLSSKSIFNKMHSPFASSQPRPRWWNPFIPFPVFHGRDHSILHALCCSLLSFRSFVIINIFTI